MKKTMTIKQAAERWKLSERRIATLCKEGRIFGAYKEGHLWLLPQDAVRPMDHRIKSGAYQKSESALKRPLPIGISDFREAVDRYYYIDKTMMIKEFLDEVPKVSLFTRPRRFGKTLNMDMLRVFFEKTNEDTSVYFKDKKIWSCGEKYRKHQGMYPVIFVTFKDVKFETWQDTIADISTILAKEYSRHSELLESSCCGQYEKEYFKKILAGDATDVELTQALQNLSQMLDEHYGIPAMIIIDEYDTPIQQGYAQGFYDKVILFMRNLFSGGLKDNRHLSYGFMTGILRVARESIFSGLNNLKINSILDTKYSEYFGFTTDEVHKMTEYYDRAERYEEICSWYNGYRFGNSEIFNPWSVVNYFSNDCQPKAYWQSTGSNDIIGDILDDATEEIYERLNALVQGESFLTYVDTGVIYPQIRSNPSSIYSFLLVAGYLKVVKSELSFNGDYMCEVALPNREIAFVYNKEILGRLTKMIPQSSAIAIQEAIYSGNVSVFQNRLQKLLTQSVSYFDTFGENFYHGLMLGLCTMLDERYSITSNQESGDGRYDLCLFPKTKGMPGILIELKAARNCPDSELEKLSSNAIMQIENMKYDSVMKGKGIERILKYGIAFSGKNVACKMK